MFKLLDSQQKLLNDLCQLICNVSCIRKELIKERHKSPKKQTQFLPSCFCWQAAERKQALAFRFSQLIKLKD